MDERDLLLAKLVVEIHRKRLHSQFVFVPLFSIYQIHPINRSSSLDKTQNRIKALQAKKTQLIKAQRISNDDLAMHLPSVSSIKAVQENRNSYLAYEGNGRLVALRTVFSPDDNIFIEIEEYCFENASNIIQKMNKLRQLHGLIADNNEPEQGSRG